MEDTIVMGGSQVCGVLARDCIKRMKQHRLFSPRVVRFERVEHTTTLATRRIIPAIASRKRDKYRPNFSL